ncbi:quinate-4 [Rhypophila decipiens]|uniref:Quinate-4 n=1 Tax=Rhypophila decipiens TaxID=261697 RepID=A0AAN6Y163_9PEZI|nr:quinate-4 [Rhypophila decipiens]
MPCKLAIPTMSLGHCWAGHSLDTKLDAAKSCGYQGVEVSYEDIVGVALKQLPHLGGHHHLHHHHVGDKPLELRFQLPPFDLRAAASTIKAMCKDRDLEIISLQPFPEYEGLIDAQEQESRFDLLLVWIGLARALGTDLIMVPANSLPKAEVTSDLDRLAQDFQRACDAPQSQEDPPMHFAYEPRVSATYIDRWEYAWDLVERVDRPGFGLCLDTFHLAAVYFGDPSSPSGCLPDGAKPLKMSMDRLVRKLGKYHHHQGHRDKVFLVQMGDARRLDEPLYASADCDPEQRPSTTWSRDYRLFYREEPRGAFLPIREVADAIFNGVRYEGWVSLELFNKRMGCGDPNVPADLAQRGLDSWHRLTSDMGWWPPLPQPV